jgi:FlaA1/EpsC-like NDP-sugar epimerase
LKLKFQIRNRYVLIVDLGLIVVSVVGSYVLRLELGPAFYFYLPSAYWMAGVALLVKPLVYYQFGLYRRMWIYASTQELKIIVAAVSTSSMIVGLIMISLFSLRAFTGLPRSALVIDWLLSMALVGGVRFTVRLLAETRILSPQLNHNNGKQQHILIIGAGDAGALVVRELQKNPQLNMVPIGFLDDNPSKQRQELYGVSVVGLLNDLSGVLEKQHVDEVVIAIPSAPGKVIRLVTDVCRLKGVPFRTMPGIYELIGGKVSVSRLREVDITDLLRREPVHTLDEALDRTIDGKVVLVTGAGGSIGKELSRQVALHRPSKMILLGHGENSIFEAMLELKGNFPSLSLQPVILDIRDMDRLSVVFDQYKPEVVFHTAAHKHVPLMEVNIEDAVTNNILGTMNVVEASVKTGVKQLVMISTDKAIRPANVMGATKRLAEMIILDAAYKTGRAYSVVRFGNVLGSRGSVVPIFKQQIAAGGPVTITHPDMERYFMTIPEAVHLVLSAASMGQGQETFVLNMGKQVRILDLAEDLIRLSGLEPGKDIEIVFTGIRPGEKLSEDLWDIDHTFRATNHPDIYLHECQENLKGDELFATIDRLIELARLGEVGGILQLMNEVIPGATVFGLQPTDITSIY